MEEQITEPITPHHYQCDKCERSFQSAPALRMHKVRTHGKGWDTSANFGRGGIKRASEQERLSKRRAYQRKLRARYKLQGRDSRGYPLKRKGGTTGMKLPSWSPERRTKFHSTWLSKNRQKKVAQTGTKGSRIHYVYNLADEAEAQAVKAAIRFCPHCGTNIEKHL